MNNRGTCSFLFLSELRRNHNAIGFAEPVSIVKYVVIVRLLVLSIQPLKNSSEIVQSGSAAIIARLHPEKNVNTVFIRYYRMVG